MNKTKSIETEYACAHCLSSVVDDYGNVRCSNIHCVDRDRDVGLSWDDTKEDVQDYLASKPNTYVQYIRNEYTILGNRR